MNLIEFIKHPAYNYYVRNNNKFNFYLKTYSND